MARTMDTLEINATDFKANASSCSTVLPPAS
jgi:hypothetical protein